MSARKLDLSDNQCSLDEHQVSTLIQKLSTLPDGELEIRFGEFRGLEPTKQYFDTNIGYVEFSRLHTYLSRYFEEADQDMNPLCSVDRKVVYDNEEYRVSVRGQDNIDIFLSGEGKNASIVNPNAVEIIKKQTLSTIDDIHYGYRLSLSREVKIDGTLKAAILRQRFSGRGNEMRLKQRYSFVLPQILGQPTLRFDLTSVVQNDSTTYQFEIEVLHNFQTKQEKRDCRLLLSTLYEFLVFRQDSGFLTNPCHLSAVLHAFKSECHRFWGNRNFPGMKPVTVSPNNIHTIRPRLHGEYTVTWKADGLRYVLFIYQQNLFFIDSNFKVIPTYMTDKSHALEDISILDGEYITKDLPESSGGEFYVFDIFVHKNKDTKGLPLLREDQNAESRVSHIKSFFRAFQAGHVVCRVLGKILTRSLDLIMKPYEIRQLEKMSKVYADMPKSDGVIFTPSADPYPLNGSTFYSTFKWKKPSLNTIDFLVKLDKQLTHGSQKYVLARLFVSHDGNEQEFSVDNVSLQRNKDYPPTLSPMYIPLLDAKAIAINDNMSIQTDTVVECVWGNFTEYYGIADPIVQFGFVPYRVRVEKTKKYFDSGSVMGCANSRKTALSIWESLVSPITIDQLFTANTPQCNNIALHETKVYYKDTTKGGNFYETCIMQFHNYVKESVMMDSVKLLNAKSGHNTIRAMDVGCGQGGDLIKWAKVEGLDSLAMTDLIESNVARARERLYGSATDSLSNSNWNTNHLQALRSKKVLLEPADFSKVIIWPTQSAAAANKTEIQTPPPTKDNERLLEFLSETGPRNLVATFFCLHFFYESREKLSRLLWNINRSLEMGGVWIGTFMDGADVYGKELVKVGVDQEIGFSCNDGKRDVFTLVRKEPHRYNGDFGYKMAFKSVKISGAANESFVEYLVDIGNDIFQEFGFSVEYVRDFESYWELFAGAGNRNRMQRECPRLYEWAALHKSFCFVKVEDVGSTHRVLDGIIVPVKDICENVPLPTLDSVSSTVKKDSVNRRKRTAPANSGQDTSSRSKKNNMGANKNATPPPTLPQTPNETQMQLQNESQIQVQNETQKPKEADIKPKRKTTAKSRKTTAVVESMQTTEIGQ